MAHPGRSHRGGRRRSHRGPATGETLLDGTEWVYTTGAVLYGLGEPRVPTKATEYLDRDTNTNTARIIGTSVVAFDPCSASAIEYGFPDYTEGS